MRGSRDPWQSPDRCAVAHRAADPTDNLVVPEPKVDAALGKLVSSLRQLVTERDKLAGKNLSLTSRLNAVYDYVEQVCRDTADPEIAELMWGVQKVIDNDGGDR